MAERRIINGYIVERRDDGTIVTIGPAQPQMPADPAFQYAGPKAAADAQRAQAQATVESSTIDAQIRRANAEAAGWNFQAFLSELIGNGRLKTPAHRPIRQPIHNVLRAEPVVIPFLVC